MRRMFRGIRNAWHRHEIAYTMLLLMFVLLIVYFWPTIFVSIGVGQRGVLWSRFFGTETESVYAEGLHLIMPWNELAIYNVRYQITEQTFEVLSKDGLPIRVDVTIRYRPSDKLIGRLHQQVGPDYLHTVIIPEVGNAVRLVISGYEPEGLYAGSFGKVEDEVVELARREVRDRFVFLDDVLVRAIVLPPIVSNAIQRKLEQEQAAYEMKYRIERERLEADRKRAEAEGIRDFQATISAGLTEQYLRYKGIEATLELAKSDNTKVIVIGGGQTGLPLVLNPDNTLPAPTKKP
jgi:regulator of protease activity HflC (stomatin/prohibitin superfamily)